MVKLNAIVETYVRYGIGGIRNIEIEGNSKMEVLKFLVEKIGCYLSEDEIKEEGLTEDDIIENLKMNNGDGCDFIFDLTINGNNYIGKGYSKEHYKL